jgi:hypothetical protein
MRSSFLDSNSFIQTRADSVYFQRLPLQVVSLTSNKDQPAQSVQGLGLRNGHEVYVVNV